MHLGIACITMLVVFTSSAAATVYTVHPDGSGDYPTIQSAISAAVPGDLILLGDGTFIGEGNRDIDYLGKALTIRSQGGVSACIINAQGSEEAPHRGFIFHKSESTAAVLEGVTITGGWHEAVHNSGGGAILCAGSSPTIRDCVFTGNQTSAVCCINGSNTDIIGCEFRENTGRVGGGLYFQSGSLTITDCLFSNNTATYSGSSFHGHGGSAEFVGCTIEGNTGICGVGGDFIYYSQLLFRDCLFRDNVCSQSFWNCIINLHGMVTANFEYCTFTGNSAGEMIVTSKMSHGIMSNCTLYDNIATGDGIIVCGETDFLISNTIIAFNPEGMAVNVGEHSLEIECTNLFGNPDGNWIGALADELDVNGNISLDPRFCDAANGDLTLADDSPCAPFNGPDGTCDLVGAWPVDCVMTAVAPVNWSRIKALY